MKKLINIAIIINLGILTAFANNEKAITANFEIDNQDSSPYHFKLTSKTDPKNETVFDVPALSKTNFKAKKTQSEWAKSTLSIVESSQDLGLSAIANESLDHHQSIEHISDDEVHTSKNGSFILNEVQNIKANTTKDKNNENQQNMNIVIEKKYFLKKNQK